MILDFAQVGNSSIRIELDGVRLAGGHSMLHTALERAAKVAAENPDSDVVVVQEQRIRVTAEIPTDTQATVWDGGSASSFS